MGDNPGAYPWTVPKVLCNESCLIRVTTENAAVMVGSDDSDFAFSIVPTGTAGAAQASLGGGSGGRGGGCFIATLRD
jgi:hypothetical protein